MSSIKILIQVEGRQSAVKKWYWGKKGTKKSSLWAIHRFILDLKKEKSTLFHWLNYHSLDLKQSSRYSLADMDNSSLVFKV